MKDSIFDLLETEAPEGKEGYFEIAKNAPQPKDKSFFNDIKEYSKTALKGAIEGISRLGTIFSPTGESGYNREQQLKQQTEALDELIPTEEGFGQRALRRGLREAPTVMIMGGTGGLPRSIAAGFLGESAKDLGAPEWAQAVAELTAFIGPDITKKLLESGSDKFLITRAKQLGLTDEQITPLIQSEFKQKWLSKLVPKRGSTQKVLAETKSGLGKAYETLRSAPEASSEISEKTNGHLINSLKSALADMPRKIQAKISKDMGDLLNNKITPNTLMNFYRDVNAHLSGNSKQLSLLKEPIRKAIASVSPELSKDFEFVNQLYSKYSTIAGRLQPTLTSDIISAAEALGITGSVLFGNYPTLLGIMGEKAGKKLAQKMLLDPRFQQLSQRMIVAANRNSYMAAKKVVDSMNDLIRIEAPEYEGELKDLSLEEFQELFSRKKTAE